MAPAAPVPDPVASPAPEPAEPPPAPAAAPEPPTPTPAAPATETPFDPVAITEEVRQETFVDVRALIANLNAIIQSKDYDAWVLHLTTEYRDYYSAPETLMKLSESPVLKRQGIELKSLRDYFYYVVYPSRQNDRVDDIEFMGKTRIRAIVVNPKGERLVLYNLEKIGDTWMIAIWR